MKRKAMWVTVDGNIATVSTRVHSTHRTWEAAQRTALRAQASGEDREAMCAQLVSVMQSGMPYTEAVQSLAGSAIEPAIVLIEK